MESGMRTFPSIRTCINELHGYHIAQRNKGKHPISPYRQWLLAATRCWQRRKMIAALEAMDDRLLQDIGIHRDEIPHVVDGFSDRELRMTPLASPQDQIETYDDTYPKAV